MIALETLGPCFQGLIPAWLCTCSREGIPNVAILSHVDYVDARHVALSFQFFNKSRRNIAENPRALVRLYDPDTMQGHVLQLRYVRTETAGPLFESMRLRIESIASYSGLKGIFRLLGADVYEVLGVERLEHDIGVEGTASVRSELPTAFTLKAMQELGDRIQRAASLECLLESVLESLEEIFGFRHSMVLLTGDTPDRLELIASRGYPAGGVGSEVAVGDGAIGIAAEARRPIRVSGMLRHMLYANAVGRQAEEQGLCPRRERTPLPGLAEPETQLAIPLLAHDELLGVLCVETEQSFRFHEEDRAYLEVLGGYIAIAIQNSLLLERAGEPGPGRDVDPAVPIPDGLRPRIEVAWYPDDDVILVDGEYLVRGVPARILWKLLREHRDEGTVEFTNRRLRLDKSLQLPEWKDNLESRLILLRKRLLERCPEIALVPAGRGRFRLEMGATIDLVEAS